MDEENPETQLQKAERFLQEFWSEDQKLGREGI